jgi:hypothetical protein
MYTNDPTVYPPISRKQRGVPQNPNERTPGNISLRSFQEGKTGIKRLNLQIGFFIGFLDSGNRGKPDYSPCGFSTAPFLFSGEYA